MFLTNDEMFRGEYFLLSKSPRRSCIECVCDLYCTVLLRYQLPKDKKTLCREHILNYKQAYPQLDKLAV